MKPICSTFGFLTLVLTLAGCPDPNPTGGPEREGSAPNTAEEGTRGPGPGPDSTTPDQAHFTQTAKDGVEISGQFVYKGEKTGAVRIDFLKIEDSAPPRLVHTVQLRKIGDWKIYAPHNFGDVYVVGFIDLKSDGPSSDDPSGMLPEPLSIGDETLDNIQLQVADEGDLGALTPGAGLQSGPKPGAAQQGDQLPPPPPEGDPGAQPAPDGAPGGEPAPEGAPGGEPAPEGAPSDPEHSPTPSEATPAGDGAQ